MQNAQQQPYRLTPYLQHGLADSGQGRPHVARDAREYRWTSATGKAQTGAAEELKPTWRPATTELRDLAPAHAQDRFDIHLCAIRAQVFTPTLDRKHRHPVR
jgi:hypothetical protein